MAANPSHGGKRPRTGPKTTKPTTTPHSDTTQRVHERGIKELEEIFDLMLKSAKGIKLAVRPKKRGRNSEGEIVWECEDVETGETWLVYEQPPNDKQLQYLYDQLAGRAAAKSQEANVPDLHVYFGDIDCVETTDETPKLEPQPEVEEPVKRPTLGLNTGGVRPGNSNAVPDLSLAGRSP